jgi:autotransporter-associated beta strand protein
METIKTHRLIHLICFILLPIAFARISTPLGVAGEPFVHPGGLHTQADFDRMKAKVTANASPWVDSYNQLTALSMANLGWPWHPVTQIVRGTSPNNYARSQLDALAIYYLALRYHITGDTNYANEAIRGMDAWSGTMTNGVGGNSNYALGAGICGYEFAVAGEALHGYAGWSPASMNAYSNFLMRWYGSCIGFMTGHNGTCDSHYWCNWDGCNLAAIMAIGVFCDNTNIFNYAVQYLETGNGNGNLTSAAWYVHTNGLAQWQESGRDQAHTMDGVAWLAVALQIAWNQGVDLYGFDNNRYLRGAEYAAKYNLWQDVPYVPFGTCDSSESWGTTALSSGSRGFLPPTWDLIYNHYVNIKGLAAPYTAQAAAVLRPDGYYNNPNSPDFMGFTTLTCLLDPIPAGAVPSGVTASRSGTNVTLTWWGSAYATNYCVKRATTSGGPYATIGTVPASADRMFVDSSVTNGATFYYVVTALDRFGESATSPETFVVVLNQLTAFYKFDEGGGATAADSAGLSPAATLMNGAAFATGRFGQAVSLNGSSQYVALPNGLLSGLGDFTIATWVDLNNVTVWTRIFDFGADTDRYMFLTPDSGSGTVRFAMTKFGGNGEQQINGLAPLATGWHHVAVTLQGTDGAGVGILYVDGAPVGTNDSMYYTPTMIGGLINATNNFIGRSQFPGDPYLNGRVDDFRIYNGALTAEQIATLYAAAPPAAPLAPASVTAAAESSSAILLSWPPAAGATSYLIQRSPATGGPYTLAASGVTATNYTDTGLSGGTSYYYVITPVNDGGEGANSMEAGAITLTPPAIPASLVATGMYGGQIALSWSASADATSYNVKRSTLSGGPYVTIAAGLTGTSDTNSGLILNATYYYVVSAVNANGESANSSEAASFVPVPTLTWVGNVSTAWDVALTTNWLFGNSPSTYFTDGSAVLFNDSASNSLVNLPAGVAPYSVTFSNSSMNYTVGSTSGSGIGGSATLAKFGAGTATLTTTNTFTGDIAINGGGTLAIGGGGLLGGGNYSGNIMNYGTFAYNSTAAQTLAGNIFLSGAVSKTGTGALTLTKANDYSGATTLNSGSLSLAGFGGILKSSPILIGNSSGGSAALLQSGINTLVSPGASQGALQVASTPGGGGYYRLDSGNLSLAGEIDIGGSSGGAGTFGQFDMDGGAIALPNATASYFLPNRGGAGESSVVNLSGGTVGVAYDGLPAYTGANGFTANWSGSGAAQTNTTTISGSASFLTPSLNANLNYGGNSANVINLNLNGGVLQVLAIPTAAGACHLNFDGGTLKAGISGGSFVNGLQSARIYGGGAVIDDNGQSIAVDQPLAAPAGNGVSSVPVATAGAGYVMPPQVSITGGGGSNATAYATIAGGAVSGVVVTCPGLGYSSAPTVRFIGGGYSSPATPGAAVIAANVSGGLTKLGAGTLTLGGSNSYTGQTIVGAGTLKLGDPLLYLSFDSTSGATVLNQGSGGPALNGVLTGTNVAIVSGGHSGMALMVSNGPVNTGYVLVNNPVVNLNNSGAWTWGMWIKTTNAGAAYLYQGSGGWVSGNSSFYLNPGSAAAGGTKGGGVRWGQGWQSGTTGLNDGKWHYLAMTCNNGTKVLYVDGRADTWTANAWSGSGTGNQIWIGGTADTGDGNAPFNGLIDDVSVYSRALSPVEVTNLMNGFKATSPALPANANVTVNSGATLYLDALSQTIGSLAGSNSSTVQLAGNAGTALVFGNDSDTIFAGSISGHGSVTKNGAGTITLSGPNSYAGATIINSGTVRFGQSDNTNYVASLGPLLWFNFDQGIGDGVVTNLGSGGPAMNAILNGNASITSAGRYGNALYLDGASDLEIDNEVTPLDCNATGASWTYALWIKTGTAGAVFGYQGDGTWSADATTFYLNNNGASAGTRAGGVRWGDGWLTGTTTLTDNSWHFVAITVSAGVKTIYVDGHVDSKTGTTGWAAPAMTYASQFLIGETPDAGDGGVSFAGFIDEVYLFNRALSLAEVQNIMANRSVDTLGTVTGQLPAGSAVSLAAAAAIDLAGTTQTVASLSDMAGAGGLVTNSAGPGTLILNGSGSNTFSGQFYDPSPASALSVVKSGAGTEILAGQGVIHGPTIISNGTLVVEGTLGADGIAVAGGILAGSGTLSGDVMVDSAGALWPGAAGGPSRITCNNDLLLAGTTFMALNKSSLTNDSVAVGGSLNYGGVLVVTNVAGALANGDNFALFSAPRTTNSFASLNLPALNLGSRWSFNPTNGVLSVVPIRTTPVNLGCAISNNALLVSWPADHIGWRLQVQTNAVSAGLGTNWVTVDGSTNFNQAAITPSPAAGMVFYRLVYP